MNRRQFNVLGGMLISAQIMPSLANINEFGRYWESDGDVGYSVINYKNDHALFSFTPPNDLYKEKDLREWLYEVMYSISGEAGGNTNLLPSEFIVTITCCDTTNEWTLETLPLENVLCPKCQNKLLIQWIVPARANGSINANF